LQTQLSIETATGGCFPHTRASRTNCLHLPSASVCDQPAYLKLLMKSVKTKLADFA